MGPSALSFANKRKRDDPTLVSDLRWPLLPPSPAHARRGGGTAVSGLSSAGSGTGAYTAPRQPKKIPSEARFPLYSRADVRRRSNRLPPGHRVLCRGTISENTGDFGS